MLKEALSMSMIQISQVLLLPRWELGELNLEAGCCKTKGQQRINQ
jgi:hypothetical protein